MMRFVYFRRDVPTSLFRKYEEERMQQQETRKNELRKRDDDAKQRIEDLLNDPQKLQSALEV